MVRRREFAPVSGAPSARLRFVTGYFALWGALSLAMLVIGVGAAAARDHVVLAVLRAHPFGPLVRVAITLLMLGTADLFSKRSRLGGVTALLVFFAPVFQRLIGEAVSNLGLVAGLVGLLLTVSVWGELGAGDSFSD